MSEIQTERLVLRRFRRDDFEAYAAICADADVMRYLADGRPLSRDEAWFQMAWIVGHWALRGYGPWALEERDSGALVGRIGFIDAEGWPGFELAWMLRRSSWGRGYATEGARAALTFAFEELRRDHVVHLIHPDNIASMRLAERLGARPEGSTRVRGHEVLVYGTRPDRTADPIR